MDSSSLATPIGKILKILQKGSLSKGEMFSDSSPRSLMCYAAGYTGHELLTNVYPNSFERLEVSRGGEGLPSAIVVLAKLTFARQLAWG